MAKILVVDDNVAMCELLSDILNTDHHEVVTAGDGIRARSAAGRQEFDLMITDISMPNEEGFGLIRAMRKLHPHVRILVLSGKGADLLEDARILGADLALQKPADTRTILDSVAKLLSSRQRETGLGAKGRQH